MKRPPLEDGRIRMSGRRKSRVWSPGDEGESEWVEKTRESSPETPTTLLRGCKAIVSDARYYGM
jgi:hypothetical protein